MEREEATNRVVVEEEEMKGIMIEIVETIGMRTDMMMRKKKTPVEVEEELEETIATKGIATQEEMIDMKEWRDKTGEIEEKKTTGITI